MLRAAETRPPLPAGFFDEVGRITLRVSRAVGDVRTWRPVLLDQMVVLGVGSVPIAIFLAVFTGMTLQKLLTKRAVPDASALSCRLTPLQPAHRFPCCSGPLVQGPPNI